MSAVRGRARRAENTPTVPLQGRVDPVVRQTLDAAAEASGLSLGLYVDLFVTRTLETEGKLPVLRLASHQEELPIEAA